MPRITAIDPREAKGTARTILDDVRRAAGGVPNLLRTMAQAPAVLRGYVDLSNGLAGGPLDHRLREQIALTVAGLNGCDYCASAHTALARKAGVERAEAERNLSGRADDPAVQAALTFVRTLVDKRGRASDADLAAVRAAGYGDATIIEIVGHVALNTFTNYVNNVAETEIDFPVVTARPRVAA